MNRVNRVVRVYVSTKTTQPLDRPCLRKRSGENTMDLKYQRTLRGASIAALGATALSLLSSLPGLVQAQAPEAQSTVQVRITGLRNSAGTVGCRLYLSSKGFPQGSEDLIQKYVQAPGGDATCSFKDVKPGTYAVAVMHDENSNKKLDKNMFGKPTEGYGVSNNKTYALRAPKWEESKFTVEAGKDVSLSISLRY